MNSSTSNSRRNVMSPIPEWHLQQNRRQFFSRTGLSLGTIAMASLLQEERLHAATPTTSGLPNGLQGLPHFAPTAKRVIYLFQSGGPSQMDLFDYKPQLEQWRGQELPDSIRRGQRLTGMTSRQTSF